MTLAGPIPDSYWLLEGRFLAGEYPGASSPDDARRKLKKFLEAGIRTFIDLTEEREPLEPYDALLRDIAGEQKIDCRHERFGIRDVRCPSVETMRDILAVIRREVDAGRPVYVHCWGGVGRTGTVAGCWLVEQGMTADEALQHIKELRRRTPDGYRPSPETAEQRAFIRSWPAERGKSAGQPADDQPR